MTNKSNTTLYIGVTSDLQARIAEHREHSFQNSFTDRYKLEHCIYFETHSSITEAIAREKQIKKWRREKKNDLINSMNPEWTDLWEEIKKW